MQVSLLKLNSGISHSVEAAGTLERVNADLETEVARLSSGERIQLAAADEGMVAPPAGDVGYLTARARRRSAPGRRAHAVAERRRARGDGQRRPRARRPRARHRDPRDPRRRATVPPAAATDARAGRHGRAGPHGHARPRRPPRRSRSRPPPRAPAPRRPRRAEMKLIERRIGLLFAVFLSLLVIGAGKAAWLGVVKAGTLKQAAATQQEADLVVPARRGAITDRTGTELAVSQPAMTIAATPYLIKDPARVAAQPRRPARQARGRDPAPARPPRHRLRLRRPPRPGRARPQGPGAEGRGHGVHPRVHARVPARVDGLAAARLASAPTTRACPASSTRRTSSSRAPTASAGSRRTRSARRSR